MSYSDQAAMRSELNQVKLKLLDAGVQLDGHFKWRLVQDYWNPVGFDFTCDDPKRLQQVAEKSDKLGIESIDMSGYDPWRKAGILSEQEVGILLGENDLSGALSAARDASKEWRLRHSPNENAGRGSEGTSTHWKLKFESSLATNTLAEDAEMVRKGRIVSLLPYRSPEAGP